MFCNGKLTPDGWPGDEKLETCYYIYKRNIFIIITFINVQKSNDYESLDENENNLFSLVVGPMDPD